MKKIIPAALLVIMAAYFLIPSKDANSFEAYRDSIMNQRAEKDKFFNNSSNSPFYPVGDSAISLNYYAVDEKFKVIAKIDLVEEKRTLTLGNSDGSSTSYRKYAIASFELDGNPFELTILKNLDTGILFTAFSDETSALETYGAGRYLDLEFDRATRITLDFNLAYNPYCAYNHDYSCPLPPRENYLNIAIKAGELKY